jgi:hypothetical protein
VAGTDGQANDRAQQEQVADRVDDRGGARDHPIVGLLQIRDDDERNHDDPEAQGEEEGVEQVVAFDVGGSTTNEQNHAHEQDAVAHEVEDISGRRKRCCLADHCPMDTADDIAHEEHGPADHDQSEGLSIRHTAAAKSTRQRGDSDDAGHLRDEGREIGGKDRAHRDERDAQQEQATPAASVVGAHRGIIDAKWDVGNTRFFSPIYTTTHSGYLPDSPCEGRFAAFTVRSRAERVHLPTIGARSPELDQKIARTHRAPKTEPSQCQ